jgi:hypothetical protein
MANYDDRDHPAAPGHPRIRAAGWVLTVVVALLIGLGGGYLLWNTTAAQPQGTPPPSAPAATTTTTAPRSRLTQCIGIADDGATLLTQLKDAVKAIGNLDPQALEQVLNRIQQIQGELERAITDCRDQFGGAAPIPSVTPSP